MNRFKCPACGRYQYTSKDEAEGCIYCVYKGPLENMGPAGVEKANLEQAIAYFEDAIRESDEIIAECSEALQKELTEQKNHFEVALEAMKKCTWIPVSERLPEVDKYGEAYVLVCMDDEFIATTTYVKDEGFELWADSGEVMAWMPLPEPYEED